MSKQLSQLLIQIFVGDLQAREEQGRTVSAINPINQEQEDELEAMEEMMPDEKRFTNPAYEGVYLTGGQFVFEESELEANGGYSRLSSRMGSLHQKPQPRFSIDNSSSTPHYSTLELTSNSRVTDADDSGQTSAKNPKNHQYEDIDGEGGVTAGDKQPGRVIMEHINDLYEDVTITPPPRQKIDNYTKIHRYEEAGSFKQLPKEMEAKYELENRAARLNGEGWSGIQNYSDRFKSSRSTANREIKDDMSDSEVEGTSV